MQLLLKENANGCFFFPLALVEGYFNDLQITSFIEKY